MLHFLADRSPGLELLRRLGKRFAEVVDPGDLVRAPDLILLDGEEILDGHVRERLELVLCAGERALGTADQFLRGWLIVTGPPRDGLEGPLADRGVDRGSRRSGGPGL